VESKFSVLISLYNKEKEEYLKNSLESVFNQTLIPAEVIVVFDGPVSKALEEVVWDFKNKYSSLSIIKLEKNSGLGNALQIGIQHCKYDIIARMDTDDINYKNRFEKQISFLASNPNLSVVGSYVQEFQRVPQDINVYRKLPIDIFELLRFSKYRNPLNHPSVMFRKSDVLSVGSYQHMPLFEDYYLWIRLLKKGYKIANLAEALLHFRIGNDMIGRRHGFSYLQKEIRFLKAAKQIGHINNIQYIKSLAIKLPLRLLPKSILRYIYKIFLR